MSQRTQFKKEVVWSNSYKTNIIYFQQIELLQW